MVTITATLAYKISLYVIDRVSKKIEEVNKEIRREPAKLKEDLRIAISMLGMGFCLCYLSSYVIDR